LTTPDTHPDAATPTESAHAHDDQGFSLVELMVAIGILSLLMGMLTVTIVNGMRLSSNMGVRLNNINQGQLGMNAATKSLRTAVLPDQLVDSICIDCGDTALIIATSTRVTFYANLNNTGLGPSRTSYYIEQDPLNSYGNLIQATQAPTPLSDGRYTFCAVGAPGCVVTKRAIARGLSLTAAPFQYYDFDGELLTGSTLDPGQLARVNSIDVTLKVQTNRVQNDASSNTIVQRVLLPNSDINVLVQPEV
jgi:prepilin-type N-terminal cleavage/methylation domain-containing protein